MKVGTREVPAARTGAQPASKAQPRFKVPNDAQRQVGRVQQRLDDGDENLNEKPTFVGHGTWLREKKSGILHPWNQSMAQRSDLVELYEPPAPGVEDPHTLDHLSNFDATELPPAGARF